MKLLKKFSVNIMALLTLTLCCSFAVNAASNEMHASSSSVSAPGSTDVSDSGTVTSGRYGNPTVSGMKTISRPSEIDALEVQDAGLIFYNAQWNDWTTITVPEKGWVIMDTTYRAAVGVYANSLLTKQVNTQYYEEFIGNTMMTRCGYYLDQGVYYVSPATYGIAGTISVYAYFMPSSSVLSVKASLAQDCSSSALHCTSAMGTGTFYRWVKDVSTTGNIKDEDFYSNKSVIADFDVEENGTYSIRISTNDQEWKNYPIDVQITVSGIVPKPKECEHKYKTVIDQEPTCGKAGSQHQECTLCGQKGTSTTIPATGNHTYGDWMVVEQPTTTRTGMKQRLCSVCGAKETTVIDKLAETESDKTDGTGSPEGNVSGGNLSSGGNATDGNSSSVANTSGKSIKTIKVKLNSKKNVTIKKGQILQVKVKGVFKRKKVTFKSSNRKIATVSSKGIIKAKKTGKTTITVKRGKKKTKITIRVKK